VFVLDACDQARLSEGWEVFGKSPFSSLIATLHCHMIIDLIRVDEVLNSPRLLNLPLLLLANKQDSPSSLSVSEIRESFDAWQRAHPERRRAEQEARDAEADAENSNGGKVDRKGKDKAKDEEPRADGWDDDGAVEERMASLDVMGVSALEG
jgi:ADP-ribosylation factor related protein 1